MNRKARRYNQAVAVEMADILSDGNRTPVVMIGLGSDGSLSLEWVRGYEHETVAGWLVELAAAIRARDPRRN